METKKKKRYDSCKITKEITSVPSKLLPYFRNDYVNSSPNILKYFFDVYVTVVNLN